MNKKYWSFIIYFIMSVFSFGQTTNEKLINIIINSSDSLYSLMQYDKVINILTPIKEDVYYHSHRDLKYKYYTILSSAYLNIKDYYHVIPALIECSKYNCNDLEDLVAAANISVMELNDYENGKKYARRALIKYYANETIEQNTTTTRLGRLLYVLGICSYESGDFKTLKDCYQLHSLLDIQEQDELKLHLHEKIIESQNLCSSYNSQELELLTSHIPQSNINITSTSLDSIKYIHEIEKIHEINSTNIDEYLTCVLSLDSIYIIQNNIHASKRLLTHVIRNINKKGLMLESPTGIELMVRLGRMNYISCDYDEALEWYFISKQRCDEINEHGYTYITLLQNIASVYEKNNDWKNLFWRRLFIEEAIEIYFENIGNPFIIMDEYGISLLLNYALVLQNSERYEIAEYIYRHLIINNKIKSFVDYIYNDYATMLNNLQRYDESLYYYQQICDSTTNTAFMSNYICASIASGHKDSAEETLKLYSKTNMLGLILSKSLFPEYELEKFYNVNIQEFYNVGNCFAQKINTRASMTTGFNITLFCKGFPLMYNSILKDVIYNDSKSLNLYHKVTENKNKLTKINVTDYYVRDSIFQEISLTEDSLLHNMPNFTSKIIERGKSYHDISSTLNEDEIAIDFFEYTDLFADSIVPYYAAYIVNPKSDTPETIILTQFVPFTNYASNFINDNELTNIVYSPTNHYIYSQIWEKLIPYITGKKNIYYSTSGALSYINHDIVCDNSGLRLNEQYNLIRVSSSSQIETLKNRDQIHYNTAILFGGIDYNTPLNQMKDESNLYAEKHRNNKYEHEIFHEMVERGGWSNIASSNKEIDNIRDLMDSKEINFKLLNGIHANEESFKDLDGNSPEIIHVATHGFSYNKKTTQYLSNFSSYSDNGITLSYFGLLFSGANNISNTWTQDNIDDGILTAEEISTLDLSNTKLLVLSACETGKGDINLLGNVIGLQSAFKQAGVESIVMSLWKVADEPTAILMTYFYEELLNGTEKHLALKIAMSKVREKYPDPYYWGAFVILD